MKPRHLGILLIVGGVLTALLMAQAPNSPVAVAGPESAKWQHDTGDPPGSESVILREDPVTGALELLARYPAGHRFPPHWHTANERIVLLEGRLDLEAGNTHTTLEPGGYAFLPAREVQRMSCSSGKRCAFYVYWDRKLDFHRPEPR